MISEHSVGGRRCVLCGSRCAESGSRVQTVGQELNRSQGRGESIGRGCSGHRQKQQSRRRQHPFRVRWDNSPPGPGTKSGRSRLELMERRKNVRELIRISRRPSCRMHQELSPRSLPQHERHLAAVPHLPPSSSSSLPATFRSSRRARGRR